MAQKLAYEPMKFADGVIARLDCLAIGRVYRQAGDDLWTVGFGGNQTRSTGFPCMESGKGALMRLLATERPWPARYHKPRVGKKQMNTQEFLGSVLREIATAAASGAAYENWSDDFSRREIKEVWTDAEAPLRKPRDRRVTVAELRDVPLPDLYSLGFRNWDGELTLIPLWAFNYVADGETLSSIGGEVAVKGVTRIDLDVRYGCVAFGFPTPAGPDVTYTIILERISTGDRSPSMVTRQENEEAARAYAEAAIAKEPDLRIAAIKVR